MPRSVWSPIDLRNRGNLPLAEHAVAPRADERPVALEFQDRMGPAMKHEHGASRRHGHARRLDEVPRLSETGGTGRLKGPLDQFVRQRGCMTGPPGRRLSATRMLRHRKTQKANHERAEATESHRSLLLHIRH